MESYKGYTIAATPVRFVNPGEWTSMFTIYRNFGARPVFEATIAKTFDDPDSAQRVAAAAARCWADAHGEAAEQDDGLVSRQS